MVAKVVPVSMVNICIVGGRPANRYTDVAGCNPCPVSGFVE